MQETEARLTKKLVGVYRKYYLKVWTEALNVAGALVDSKWRKAKNVYYLKDLREVPEPAPEEAIPALNAAE